jgi:cyclic dehypoxanthinyl futalosine synthase
MKRLTLREGLELLREADLLELGRMADLRRKGLHPGGVVTFVVDRNINYTNVCINRCRFCAFWRDVESPQGYVLTDAEMRRKIEETLELGGTQILLQGGINPELGLDYYVGLLRGIKGRYRINVHGFSPPEVCYIADISGLTLRETLCILREAGLDSIPGGGAEILTDRVRKKLSPRKIGSARWLRVMHEAHRQGMRTSATMMFGSVERPEEILEHLDALRRLQDATGGFTAFIPWPFQPGNTYYDGKVAPATAVEYLRVLALSRLYLDNFDNVQASWVTQGLKMAQVALRFGANDMGSTMIEENVVASAGITHSVSMKELVGAIKDAGFRAAERDTVYNIIKRFR